MHLTFHNTQTCFHRILIAWLVILLGSLFVASNTTGNETSIDAPTNKISPRATIPVVIFFLGTEEGAQLFISENSGNVNIRMKLTETATTDITFTLQRNPFGSTAVQPNDYSIPDPNNTGRPIESFNIVIPAGTPAGNNLAASFSFNLNDNGLRDGDKTLVFRISNIVGAIIEPNSLTITITDDEEDPRVIINTPNFTITEDSELNVEIELELLRSRSVNPIAIQYELINSAGMSMLGSGDTPDYTDPGDLIIPAEADKHIFNINFINDVVIENDEQLTIKLLSADNAEIDETRNTAVITVNDRDSLQNKITNTGVSTCYDGNTNPLDSCAGGGDFPGQDGATYQARNYVKINENGERASEGTPWSCVFDRDSGLLWEVKTPNNSTHFFTWFRSAATVNGGDEGTPGGFACGLQNCDTERYVIALNKSNGAGLCGVNSWRLPTTMELTSLMDFETTTAKTVKIDEEYFPYTNQDNAYWANAAASVIIDAAWCVDFGKANFNNIRQCRKSSRNYLRLVSTCDLDNIKVNC